MIRLGSDKKHSFGYVFFIHKWAPCWIFAEGRFRKSQHLPRCANSLFWSKVDLQANSMTNTLPTTHVHCPTYQARFYKSKWNGHLFHKSWHLPPPNHCFGQLCCGCAICPSVCLAITHAPPSKSQTLDLTVLVHAYCILHMTMVMMTMSLPMMKVNLLEFSAFGGVGKSHMVKEWGRPSSVWIKLLMSNNTLKLCSLSCMLEEEEKCSSQHWFNIQ